MNKLTDLLNRAYVDEDLAAYTELFKKLEDIDSKGPKSMLSSTEIRAIEGR